MMKKTKLYKAADILIKFTIIVASYYIIYRELFYNQDYRNAFLVFGNILYIENIILFLIPLFLLMLLNWGIEAVKWEILVSKFEKIKIWESFNAILAGTTISSVFPNRAGEFIGRVFILKTENRIKGSLVTFIGNISQLLTTIIFGLAAFFLFSLLFVSEFKNAGFFTYSAILLLIFAIIFAMLYFYFNISALQKISKRIFKTKWKKLSNYLEVFGEYNSGELRKILFLSLIRYLVFSFQFYLCFVLFGINLNIFEGLLIIAFIYLLITAIPTVALSEIGVRGSVSLFVFSLYFAARGKNIDDYKIAIVAASALIWIINLIIPAIFGSFIIMKYKLFKK